MNLFQLTEAQQALQHRLELAGFGDQTIADSLECDDNTDALREKRLAYVAIIKNKRALANARAVAAADMAALADKEAADADRLENVLFESMLKTGDTELISVEFEAKIKGKAASVIIKDAAAIPAQYMRLPEPKPPVPAPDKKAIGEAMKRGEFVAGCELGTNKKLVIG
jgi:Siphovirus Gp157